MPPKRSPSTRPKTTAVTPALYRVDRSYNALVKGRFKGRIIDGDVILSLGAGSWLVVEVNKDRVTGIDAFWFVAGVPPSEPLSWRPSPKESLLLQAGLTVKAPMDLTPPTPMLPTAYQITHEAGGIVRGLRQQDGEL